jgi:mono/diheme cytochrome c family protein
VGYNPRVQISISGRRAWSASAALVWAGAYVVRLAAQQPPDTAALKASAGVYTDAQAARGREIFGNNCLGCHNVGSQSGDAFIKRWKGATLAEMFRLLTDQMPKDTPGSLSVQERADVMAYLLKLNDYAAATAELPPDLEQLKKIVIDIGGAHP